MLYWRREKASRPIGRLWRRKSERTGKCMIALACDHAALEMKREIIGLLDDMGLA